jgi:hypothetical protein
VLGVLLAASTHAGCAKNQTCTTTILSTGPVTGLPLPLAAAHNTHVRAYIGVTDGGWYRFLAARPELTEVNF